MLTIAPLGTKFVVTSKLHDGIFTKKEIATVRRTCFILGIPVYYSKPNEERILLTYDKELPE